MVGEIMNFIEYSVLTYSPSIISGEKINVGILFNVPESDECLFEHTKNWRRITSFDDELDIDFFKLYMKGIKEQVEPGLFSQTNWRNFIRDFTNEFSFSSVTRVEANDSVEELIEQTKRMYLRFDYAKNKRPSIQDQKLFIKKILKAKNISFTDESVYGAYNETVNYDLVFTQNVNSYGIKNFSFENKDMSKAIYYVRAWAQIADEMKDNMGTIIIFDSENVADKKVTAAIEILKNSGAKVLTLTESTNYFNELVRNEALAM